MLFINPMNFQMPQGSECNPSREWWQGNVAYHVFVPSFKDSDGDGIGDINGLISELDYIQVRSEN